MCGFTPDTKVQFCAIVAKYSKNVATVYKSWLALKVMHDYLVRISGVSRDGHRRSHAYQYPLYPAKKDGNAKNSFTKRTKRSRNRSEKYAKWRLVEEKCQNTAHGGCCKDLRCTNHELEAAVGRGKSKYGLVTLRGLGVRTRKLSFHDRRTSSRARGAPDRALLPAS